MRKINFFIFTLLMVMISVNVNAGIKIGIMSDPHASRFYNYNSVSYAQTVIDAMHDGNGDPIVEAIVILGDIYDGIFRATDEWQSGVSYTARDGRIRPSIVAYNNNLYECIEDTSTEEPVHKTDTDYWDFLEHFEDTGGPNEWIADNTIDDFLKDRDYYQPTWTAAIDNGLPVKWIVGNHDTGGITSETFVTNTDERIIPRPDLSSPDGGDYGDYAFSINNDIRIISINNVVVEPERIWFTSERTLSFLEAELNKLKTGGEFEGQRAIICSHARIDPFSTGDTVIGQREIKNISYIKPYAVNGCEDELCDCEIDKRDFSRIMLSDGFESLETCRFAKEKNRVSSSLTLVDRVGANLANASILGITLKQVGFWFRSWNADDQRQIIENAKNDGVTILGVFAGHAHSNYHTKHKGIDYYTFTAANHGVKWAIVEVLDNNMLDIEGDGKQISYNHHTFRKKPYLTYSDDNTQMNVHWQLYRTLFDDPGCTDCTPGPGCTILDCTLEWSTDPGFPVGSTQSVNVSENGCGPDEHQYSQTITGLTPGTTYYYSVTFGGLSMCNDGSICGLFWPGKCTDKTTHCQDTFYSSFTTAPVESATDLKFMVYGSTRSQPNIHNSVAAAMMDEDPAYHTFVLGAGGLVNNGDSESDWDYQFFDPDLRKIPTLRASLPFLSCMGEKNADGTDYASGDLFQKYLPYPFVQCVDGSVCGDGGPGKCADMSDCTNPPDNFWSFNYGPAHFVMVDISADFSSGSPQRAWIENDLSSTSKIWNFIVIHEPGWSAGHNTFGDNTDVQALITDLLSQSLDIDAVFSGSNNYYALAEVDGVKHVTTGGSGAPLDTPVSESPYVSEDDISRTYHYCKVTIESGTLTIESVPLGTDGRPAACWPPVSGDWIVNESCVCEPEGSPHTAQGNILVTNEAVLTIANGSELGVDFKNYNLTIDIGAGVFVEENATIIQSP